MSVTLPETENHCKMQSRDHGMLQMAANPAYCQVSKVLSCDCGGGPTVGMYYILSTIVQ